MPVVREDAGVHAEGAHLIEPGADIVGNLVGVARQKRVVKIEEHMGEPRLRNVGDGVEVGDARQEAVGFEERHGIPYRCSAMAR